MEFNSTQNSVSKFLQYDCGVKIVTHLQSIDPVGGPKNKGMWNKT